MRFFPCPHTGRYRVYCFLHINNIYSPHRTLQWREKIKANPPTAVEKLTVWISLYPLLDPWAASHVTSGKSALSVEQSVFTRDKYILSLSLFFPLRPHFVFIYNACLQNEKKEGKEKKHNLNCTERHYEFPVKPKSTESTAYRRHWGKNHPAPLLQGSHVFIHLFIIYIFFLFVDISAQWSKTEEETTLKARSLACGEGARRNTASHFLPTIPPLPPLPQRPSHTLPQCVLGSFCIQAGNLNASAGWIRSRGVRDEGEFGKWGGKKSIPPF